MRNLILLLFLFLLVSFASVLSFGGVIPVIGTIRDPGGARFNGSARFRLPLSGAIDTVCHCPVVPIDKVYPISNGTLPTYAALVPNDVIAPEQSQYELLLSDLAGRVISSYYIRITGTVPFDIGLAIQTTITTYNVSILSPAGTNTSNFFTQLQTFSAGTNLANGVLNINAPAYAGSDFGQKIAAAYAHSNCGAKGCAMFVPAGDYSGITGDSFITLNKPPRIYAHPGTVSFTYTFAAGAAFNFDWGTNNANPLANMPGAGIEGLRLIGPDTGATIGISMTTAINGAPMAVVRNSNIQKFTTGFKFPNGGPGASSYGAVLDNNWIGNNGGVSNGDGILFDGLLENARLFNNVIAGNHGFGIRFSSTASADVSDYSPSLDSNTLASVRTDAGAFCNYQEFAPHHEAGGQTWEFFDLQANLCYTQIFGGEWIKGSAGATPDHFVNLLDGTYLSVGGKAHSSTLLPCFIRVGPTASAMIIGLQKSSGFTDTADTCLDASAQYLEIGYGFPQFRVKIGGGNMYWFGSDGASNWRIINKFTNKEVFMSPLDGVWHADGGVKSAAVAFASLQTCNAGAEGTTRAVSDSNTAVWGANVAGGGANHVGAYCNGANWTVYAK